MWLPDAMILFRYSSTKSRRPIRVSARLVNPMMAFMGVRKSWDMLDKKVLLALLARLAWARASSKRVFLSRALRVSSSMLRSPITTLCVLSQSPVREAFNWQ